MDFEIVFSPLIPKPKAPNAEPILLKASILERWGCSVDLVTAIVTNDFGF